MERELQQKTDLFIETFCKLKKQYKWSVGELSLHFIALVYMLANKEFVTDELNDMIKYIKKNTKWSSYYRGHQMFSAAALLITKYDDPKQAFMSLLEYEEKMKAGGFKKSQHLFIAAYALLLTCAPEQIESRVLKAMELYQGMKKNHFWLTGSDDYPISVLLSESDDNEAFLVSEIESNYDMLLREGFGKGNGLQFLSHLLTFMPGSVQSKAQTAGNIYELLKRNGLKVSSMYYGALGYLSLLGELSEQAAEEVIEMVGYLKANKNFRWVYKDMNILAATALVANQHMEKLSRSGELLETGIGISIEAMIAVQTAAIIAATSAATTAAAASSSSSGG